MLRGGAGSDDVRAGGRAVEPLGESSCFFASAAAVYASSAPTLPFSSMERTMPLFKVEVRDKTESPPGASSPAATQPAARARRERKRKDGSGAFAIVAGAFAALLVLGGLSTWLVSRYGRLPGQTTTNGAVSAPVVPADVGDVASLSLSAPPPIQALAGVPPINPDFPRDAVIASVGAQRSYTMAELEIATRLARAMGLLAGDPVPSYEDGPGMAAFQVNLLRRQVDVMLIELAAAQAGTAAEMPPLPPEDLLADFLGKVNASRRQLDDMLAANGVSIAHLMDFLRRTQLIDFFVQSQLMAGRDQAERDAAVSEWIDAQWATQNIRIQFYDPDSIPGAAP